MTMNTLTDSEALPLTNCSAWDLPLHHPKSPFQSRSVVNWVFSHKCENCDTLIKLYQTQCDNCKQNAIAQAPKPATPKA